MAYRLTLPTLAGGARSTLGRFVLFRFPAIIVLWACVISLFIETNGARAAEPQQQPNIVLILADDLGWSDLGCYGSEVATPNIDRLAASGTRFTQFYNAARCCPTRAALLTGLYPHSAGVGHMLQDWHPPSYTHGLLPDTATIAELLHAAGYRNYHVGKWHVGVPTARTGPIIRLIVALITRTVRPAAGATTTRAPFTWIAST